MSKPQRKTTSVSTLVSDSEELIVSAHSAGAIDILKEAVDLHNRVKAFQAQYMTLRAEIDPLLKKFQAADSPSLETILATVAATKEEKK